MVVGWYPHSRNEKIASVRIRCLNPMQELRRDGYPVEFYEPERRSSYDIVVFAKRYDEASIAEAQRLKKMGVKVVFDLCDNHFYNPKRLARWEAAKQRMRQMIELADRIVVSTPALGEFVREECHPDTFITVIGDGLELPSESRAPPYFKMKEWWILRKLHSLRTEGRTPLVWFGNHGSPYADGGMTDILGIRPHLEEANKHSPISLTVISNCRSKFREITAGWSLPVVYAEWDYHTFSVLLKAHEIALIPICKNPFTICKTNNRLALALASGLAVVADEIPSYSPFSSVCFLDDWERGLRAYIDDPLLRKQHVFDSSRLLERFANSRLIAEEWKHLFDSL